MPLPNSKQKEIKIRSQIINDIIKDYFPAKNDQNKLRVYTLCHTKWYFNERQKVMDTLFPSFITFSLGSHVLKKHRNPKFQKVGVYLPVGFLIYLGAGVLRKQETEN